MIEPAMRPEAALLVDCARVQLDQRRADRIRKSIRAGLDWVHLLELAEAHGMRPLVYRHISAVCPDQVPAGVLETFRGLVSLNAARNLSLTRELLSLLSDFSSSGILAVPYKGPVLAEAIYGSLALREFADLDILVRPEDALQARALMLARTYRPQYELTSEHDRAFRRNYCEYTFTHPSSGTVVEIQWDITPRFFSLTLDREGLEKRLGTVTLLGRETVSLSPEDLLFILCVHGSKHAWSQLEWICGVAELTRIHRHLDWDLVLSLADGSSARRMLGLGLALARDLLDAELPTRISSIVDQDPAVARLARSITAGLFAVTPHGALARALLHVRMRERWSDRIRYCARLSLTPSARDLQVLTPSAASRFLAFPVRLTRLAFNYASHTRPHRREANRR
jgi:hypothetical protein